MACSTSFCCFRSAASLSASSCNSRNILKLLRATREFHRQACLWTDSSPHLIVQIGALQVLLIIFDLLLHPQQFLRILLQSRHFLFQGAHLEKTEREEVDVKGCSGRKWREK